MLVFTYVNYLIKQAYKSIGYHRKKKTIQEKNSLIWSNNATSC